MSWTFLSNHGHVALQLSLNNEATMADLAQKLSISERRVASIIRDLELAGYLVVKKVGRRNSYEVRLDRPLRHQAENSHTLGHLLSGWTEAAPKP